MRQPARSSARPAAAALRLATVDGDAAPGARPQGSRRPHRNATVARVRRLIEETPMTYGEIAAETGVGRASICRWTRDGGWHRHLFAPRATDTGMRGRAGQRLKLRCLAERLRLLAERYVRELEEDPRVDPDKLMQALQVLKMARLEAMGRRRRRRHRDEEPRTGRWYIEREDAIRAALKEINRGGVDLDRAPKVAIELFVEAYTPPETNPMLLERGRKRGRRL